MATHGMNYSRKKLYNASWPRLTFKLDLKGSEPFQTEATDGVTVDGGVLTINPSNLDAGDVIRCLVDEQVGKN
jgi:hypothetical protein